MNREGCGVERGEVVDKERGCGVQRVEVVDREGVWSTERGCGVERGVWLVSKEIIIPYCIKHTAVLHYICS